MNNRIQTFILQFENKISFADIPQLRSGILKSMQYNANVLFHNHNDEESLRYAYPLIQYKRINGKAAIVCMNEGVNVIGEYLSSGLRDFEINDTSIRLTIENAIPRITTAQVWDSSFRYKINNWLALNSKNYKSYIELEGSADRIIFLEKILTGNILSFFKGAGISVNRNIECKILSINQTRLHTFKKTKLMAFGVTFKCNATLPDYIGLGRHVSIGFGTVIKEKSKPTNINTESETNTTI